MTRKKIVPIDSAEAQRLVTEHFEAWLARTWAHDVAPGAPPPTPLAKLSDELEAIFELHRAPGFPQYRYGGNLGSWKYAPVPLNPRPKNVADPSADDPTASGLPVIYFSTLGYAPNG